MHPIPVNALAAPRRLRAPVGKVVQQSLPQHPQVEYFLYVPRTAPARDAPMVVSVHGIARNAVEHAFRFRDWAERTGCVLVAPLFRRDRFGQYQQLLPGGAGLLRADLMLHAIADEVARITGADAGRLHMFGFSGGGQFVHRFAMAWPERVATAVVGAAGWYTAPDPARRYPWGLGVEGGSTELRFEPERFLKVPAHVIVGARDVERDPALRKSKRLDRLQGRNRVERGRRWIEAMRAAAESRGLDAEKFSFTELPGADHSFTAAATRWGLGEQVFGLFEFEALHVSA
ncbi:hypothetical protein [Caulobacter sp. 17J65-9]|uniref:hypothetical protein n=1 Tax=Caulobacter sp. 17J65-9 TaxID=2709382 RepID=UPI0013CB52EE|nr:hypothetical protein [Caulobacter sp. 17J65-9]NEX93728.1 hypothetical protein [Caulobacter sp. 17J65-9]